VPIFLQYFTSTASPATAPLILTTFFFTFFTEVPFVLILGPPIIAAANKAFPSLAKRNQSEID
jgi:hypothetical protein